MVEYIDLAIKHWDAGLVFALMMLVLSKRVWSKLQPVERFACLFFSGAYVFGSVVLGTIQ